jgi:urease subunit gamma/beta
MHLTERERERLLMAAAADLARRRLARGAQLGATEAIALICDEVCELAWDGRALPDIIEHARRLIPRDRLLPGAAGLAPFIQVEALFPHGTALVHVPDPFGAPHTATTHPAGTVLAAGVNRELGPGRARQVATLTNTGPLDIWVSSHMPLDGLNPALQVEAPPGRWRADLPSGVAVRVPAGSQVRTEVIAIRQTVSPSTATTEPATTEPATTTETATVTAPATANEPATTTEPATATIGDV